MVDLISTVTLQLQQKEEYQNNSSYDEVIDNKRNFYQDNYSKRMSELIESMLYKTKGGTSFLDLYDRNKFFNNLNNTEDNFGNSSPPVIFHYFFSIYQESDNLFRIVNDGEPFISGSKATANNFIEGLVDFFKREYSDYPIFVKEGDNEVWLLLPDEELLKELTHKYIKYNANETMNILKQKYSSYRKPGRTAFITIDYNILNDPLYIFLVENEYCEPITRFTYKA